MSTSPSASPLERPPQSMPSRAGRLGATVARGQSITTNQPISPNYLKPSGHQRSRSVEEGHLSDATSISSNRSMRSTIRRIGSKMSRPFKRKPKEQDTEPTPEITFTSALTTKESTEAIGNVMRVTSTSTSTSKTESAPSVPVHRIETVIPRLKITPSSSGVNHISYSCASNGTVAINTTPALVSNTHLVRNVQIFPRNLRLPTPHISLPGRSFHFESTPQLAFCIKLLREDQLPSLTSMEIDDTTITSEDRKVDDLNRQWFKEAKVFPYEKDFMVSLASRMVAEFTKNHTHIASAIREIATVAHVLQKEDYTTLLTSFIKEFKESPTHREELLQGLVHVVQSASPGFLQSDDLVRILSSISTRLQSTDPESSLYLYHLTLAVSRILSVMADHDFKVLDREALRDPLSNILSELRGRSDPYLMYQACYAFQALQHTPGDETNLQTFLRYSTGMVDGLIKVSGLVQLNFTGFMEGLKEIQEVVEKTAGTLKSAFEGVMVLVENGGGIIDSIKQGLGLKRRWYQAILGATKFIREGQFMDLKNLIIEAPCRHEPLFQMGICQLLGEIADDDAWDVATRKHAIDFIEELSLRDQDWGQDESVKRGTWEIVSRISKVQEQSIRDHASVLERKLREEGYFVYLSLSPLRSHLAPPSTFDLLNRVQNFPDIEKDLHNMAKTQMKFHLEKHHPVYIPPQAKASLQAENNDHFPLMKEVTTFVKGGRKVFLLLGDSGAGKTTFNHMLAYEIWSSYRVRGCIPLFVDLPKVSQSDKDLITYRLERFKMSGPQIKELMEQEREFILICDGYDERQLNTNLHTDNNLNQPGSWRAKLIISCRSQYLKKKYLYDFLPETDGSSHRASANEVFQEAVIVPFTKEQVEHYVKEFVGLPDEVLDLRDRPNWTADEYMEKLDAIPDLMDLVGNPFLLTVSLRVLHQVIGGNQNLTKVRVTRIKLYDIFIDQWILRKEKRLYDNRTSLSVKECRELIKLMDDDILLMHAIEFMKQLATSIFEKQPGNHNIKYSEFSDNTTWKGKYFSNDNPKNSILRKVSPIEGRGTQFRLLHPSLLEYFYSRKFFDPVETPKEDGNGSDSDSDSGNDDAPSFQALRDSLKTHPLTKKDIVGEPLVVEFLAERARTEPRFQQQLLVMMDTMETDIESVQGAKNAVAILVEAGIRFNGVDLGTIRPRWYSST